MAAHSASQTRRPTRRAPPQPPPAAANGKASSSSKPTSPVQASLERTVKKLRLTRALTLPEATAVSGACRRMAAKRVDAALLTDANGMLSGIVTAEDIARRVIAEGLKPEETSVVKVMTRNPVFVMSNSSAIEALQKMVQGKFRHLPVVEYGEVIAMLDIKKFLYDAISRMEKAVEQGSTIAAAMEGVERQWGNDFPGPHAFMESLWEQMFKPSLSTIITENSSVPVVSPSDRVILAAKKMREHQVNSVVVMTGNMLLGILTSKDLVLRVVAHNLSPEATLVEKAMTANPDCATSDTSILDALHSMQDGKFLHIPVVDKNGQIIACLDALQLTHAAISMVEGASGAKDVANTMMQKFWDSALAIHPAEEFDARSDESRMVASDNAEGKHMHPPHVNSSFCFKIEDKKGRMHRFSCVSESLDELVSAVAYRLGMDNEKPNIKLLYDDDEGDRVLLTTDSDLNAATQHAKSAGWKVLRLHMDESEIRREPTVSLVDPSTAERWRASLRFGIVVGAVALAGVGVIVYLKRSQL
ncbi:CBS domain-containing protein CBSCBSPB3-like isoform X1 [Phragmites australis]|uniref:CBS domain-containing protein CBSCBSPB3-like isoform X1 n=1 Tax=Phragmites australis TaxID=29695 RepID=UPI002D76D5DD|nr:CBS domain-containing protein CBSCBSPB3-like isoform X1 [Phragmites australis]